MSVMFICNVYQLTFQLAKLEDGCRWMVAFWFGWKRGMFLHCANVYSLSQMVFVNAIFLFWRLMMWKLSQTTPTEMTHCSFLKPYKLMSVKYWKPFMVRAENLVINYCGPYGLVASGLLRSSPDRAVQIQVFARDNVLCRWARHLTLTVPLPSQVYKWVPVNLILGVILQWTTVASHPEGSRSTPSHFMLQKPG